MAQNELIALKLQTAQALPKSISSKKDTEQKKLAVQLYGLNDQVQKLIGLPLKVKKIGHVAAT